MAKPLNRTLTLRTAESLTGFGLGVGGPGSLQALLNMLHVAFPTVPDRQVSYGGQVIEARNVDRVAGGGLLLHLAIYTPDDRLSVVPRARNVPAANLALIDAPGNSEFLDGQLMALINGNDVALCRDGIAESIFTAYVVGLAERNEIDMRPMMFQLLKRVDMEKAELVRREGIKSISMRGVANQAAVDHVERANVKQRLLGSALDELKAVLGIEEQIPEDAENLKVEVLFSFDKKQGTVLDQRQLAGLADLVIENEDEGFEIETLEGHTVRADDIVFSTPVKLPAFGKSVRHTDAWDALREFYADLSENRRVS